MSNTWIYAVIALVVVGAFAFLFSIRVVDASETCAIVQLGNVVGEAKTGFQLVTPLITSLDCYPAQMRLYMTSADAKGDGDWMDYPVEIKTVDGQTANVEFNLNFSVPRGNALMIRQDVASNDDDLVARVVAYYARSVPRDLAPLYKADELYGAGRSDFEKEIKARLVEHFAANGIRLDDFSLRDINFSPEYEASIEAQQIAQERIETERYNAQAAVYQAEQTAALAKGDADAEIERAKGTAESVRILAAADAEAFALRGEALQAYPEIMQLEYFEALKTIDWMMVPSDINPFLQMPVPGQ